MQKFYLAALLIFITLACGGNRAAAPGVPPTNTPQPTFTPLPKPIAVETLPTPIPTHIATSPPPVDTSTPTPTPTPTPTDTPPPLPTDTSPPPANTPAPPTNTPIPVPSDTPTITPVPEPIIKYVLAGTERTFDCNFTYIYGTVKNANNIGLPNVEVRALGIHSTALEFTVRTGGEGNYEAMRFPLPDLRSADWAVMLMEDGREVSERFHWKSTEVCQSDDLGHSQVLRVDWKLIE